MENPAAGKKAEIKKVICYHCGDICRGDHVIFEGKDFCCNGCKTVYEILDRKGLCNYYDLEKNPGITIKTKNFGEKFDYLDNREIQDSLLSYRDGNFARVSFYIPSIHCSSCIWLLENLAGLRDGIRYSRVNFTKKEITIDFDPGAIPLRELVTLLSTIGYEPYISLEQEGHSRHKKKNLSLLIRMGVAGFCFGNIMLLSFPSYFGFEGIDDPGLQQFFMGLVILLSLPVVFYCSTVYFSSALAGIRAKYINIDVPVSIGIITLFMDSLVEVLVLHHPGYFDSLAGLVFFLLIGKWIQGLTYEGLSFDRDYRSYFPLAITKYNGEEKVSVPVRELKKGNIILVRNNEIIPADSILLAEKTFVDYSFITGESEPVLKEKGDFIYAGGRQVGSAIRLAVEKPVSQSYLTQLWNNEIFRKDKDSEIRHFINVISRNFTVIVLTIALVSLTVWLFIDPGKAWFIFTAVLIVACPCALSLATPFTLGSTMKIFGRNQFYVRNTSVIEDMVNINHIVFDKTGTLTESGDNKIEYAGDPLSDSEILLIKAAASGSIHPANRSILHYGNNGLPDNPDISDFEEIPGLGIKANVKGHEIKIGSRKFMENLLPEGNNFTEPDQSRVFVAIDKKKTGYFLFKNRYRDDIDQLAGKLSGKWGLSILSGDNEAEKKFLNSLFPEGTEMKFRQDPEKKLNYINELQSNHRKVMMLGDGLNDAGALKTAEVGIAVTDDITLFTPASDAILKGDKLNLLPRLISFTHTARKIIIASLIISFLYNLIGLGYAVSGLLSPLVAAILMPASSISVVAFSTLMVSIFARINKL